MAEQVFAKGLIANRVAPNEVLIVQTFADQHVGQRQHQRGVAAGANRQPLNVLRPGQIVAQRADVDELHAGLGHLIQRAGEQMLTGATGAGLGVFCRQATEGDEQFAMPGQVFP
ncbi:hypothetical protein D3C86_1408180 [compost metagenome]